MRLNMAEEIPNEVGGYVGDGQPIDGRLVGIERKRDQQAEHVPIAALRIAGQIAFDD